MQKKANLPFTGISSFMKKPICTDLDQLDAHAAIIGAPYDQTTQYRAGCREGAEAIRVGSKLVAFTNDNGVYDPERDEMYLTDRWKIVDCGDADMLHGDLEYCHNSIEQSVAKIVSKGAIPVVLGGDHSITIPALRGMKAAGPFCVVHVDAHLDFADDRCGQRYGHGSPLRRASEMDHVRGMAQIGMRGLGSSMRSDFEDARKAGSVIMTAREVHKIGIEEVLSRIPQSEKYYVTIDVDGLDPSIAVGTGTPSAGGLSYYEINELLEGVAKKGDVVGMDFVEVAPQYDPAGVTPRVAAMTVLNMMAQIMKYKKNKSDRYE